MRFLGGIVIGVVVLSGAGLARADGDDSFDALASGAHKVDRAQFGDMVWALSAKCAGGDELAKRQCRAVRDAVAAKVADAKLIVNADHAALTVGAFDDKKKSASVMVTGCIACDQPVTIDGAAVYVVGDNGGMVRQTDRAFRDENAMADWKTKVAPRLQIQFVVSMAGSASWSKDGKQGVSLKVLGFRVFDPCDGGIVCASPHADKAEVDHAACGDTVAEGKPDQPKPATTDDVPDELTADQIMDAMKPIRDEGEKCEDKFGVPGDGKLKVTVAADGSVVAVDQTGDFQGTPTGSCLEAAVKKIVFPKTKKAKQSFRYPVILR